MLTTTLLEQKSVLTLIATEIEEHVRAMHKAVGWYANGVDSCPEFKVSLYEWEFEIKSSWPCLHAPAKSNGTELPESKKGSKETRPTSILP